MDLSSKFNCIYAVIYHSGPSSQSGSCSRIEIIDGHHSHERQLHVGVRVYPTRDDQTIGGVDDANRVLI